MIRFVFWKNHFGYHVKNWLIGRRDLRQENSFGGHRKPPL